MDASRLFGWVLVRHLFGVRSHVQAAKPVPPLFCQRPLLVLGFVNAPYWFETMAFFRRRDVAQAFRDNQQLQQFVLNDVTAIGTVLGTGSYGSVEEVSQSAKI